MVDELDSCDREIARVSALSHQLIDEYVSLSGAIVIGEVQNAMYGEIFDFVNFRIETADTCLRHIVAGRIADALGLCRSLLEHYLLLMLMCRGRKYFRLQNLENKTSAEFKEYLKEQQAKLAEQHAHGEALACLRVQAYPRAARHLMYVFEGLEDEELPGFFIPIHYFEFRNFRPDTMRLKYEDYFVYHEPSPDLKKANKDYRKEATHLYRHYLSYDSLIQCLELNGFLDSPAVARLEAHYTFLGQYLHPTHDAARMLHEHNNVRSGETSIGMSQPYSKPAILLAALYVCYCLAGLLDEVVRLIESAPPKYITDPGTAALRQVASRVPSEFPYFWFLFNEAPLYDKFNYASYHVSADELASYGHYSKVPSEMVTFDQHIYSHLQRALSGWSNTRCGVYESPLGKK